jgi:hypothetical protein
VPLLAHLVGGPLEVLGMLVGLVYVGPERALELLVGGRLEYLPLGLE